MSNFGVGFGRILRNGVKAQGGGGIVGCKVLGQPLLAHVWVLYKDYCRDPVPNSLSSTGKLGKFRNFCVSSLLEIQQAGKGACSWRPSHRQQKKHPRT